jgi:hypothetical protein
MGESASLPRSGYSPALQSGGRGVTAADVERAADALLREGERPTVEKVRARLGGGSPNTINPLLDGWWKRIGARLASGPDALQRLPELVAHVAEALWLQALEEARRRVGQEERTALSALEKERREFEVRSHVLTLRESELDNRLRDRERAAQQLEGQVRDLLAMLQKEQASRAAAEARAKALEAEVSAADARSQRLITETTSRSSPRAAPPRQPKAALQARPPNRSRSR